MNAKVPMHIVRPANRKPQVPTPKQALWSAGRAASMRDDDKTKLPKLTTPNNGPGFTLPKCVGSMPKSPERISTSSIREPYDGQELKVNPGITPDRMEAFSLPSRSGNKYRVKKNGIWVDA